ncbi:MAG TPA: YihY/virulence factor BrkB family protein [Roseiflexaceae bacterium]|nr:YihY/virulence factor BrkB family protein [Roseiflexaceae bacterium]
MSVQIVWELLKETFTDWNEDKAPRLAAALSYYALFAIAPLLVIVIAIAGFFFGREAASGAIVGQIQGLVGEQSAQTIQEMVANAAANPSGGIIATVIGIVTLLFGALGVFGQLQDALNTIWEVQPKPNRGWLEMLKDRLAPFTMVLGIAFLLLTSLVISAALSALGKFFGGVFPGYALLGQIINFIISFAVITLLFAMMYKYLPDVKIAWSDVWIGAAFTALLFTIGRLLIGIYLGRSSTASTYGAAGSLVIVLLWVYYSAQILFMGAEFTQVYAKKYGTQIEPAENAMPITEEARAQQGIPHEEEKEEALQEREVGRAAPGAGGHSAPAPTASPAVPPSASMGAVAGFFIGLILGRRQRSKE